MKHLFSALQFATKIAICALYKKDTYTENYWAAYTPELFPLQGPWVKTDRQVTRIEETSIGS